MMLEIYFLFQDTTNYVHIHDSINDANEDSMNVNLKKKVIRIFRQKDGITFNSIRLLLLIPVHLTYLFHQQKYQ